MRITTNEALVTSLCASLTKLTLVRLENSSIPCINHFQMEYTRRHDELDFRRASHIHCWRSAKMVSNLIFFLIPA
jgi:TPP-dependent trihydroxycyclohexane-1,2-dione (THcHDO) dehydratase